MTEVSVETCITDLKVLSVSFKHWLDCYYYNHYHYHYYYYKQNQCLSLGNKSTFSLRLMEQATFVLIYKVHNHRILINLKTWTSDCGLGAKHGLSYKTWTVDLKWPTDKSPCLMLTSHTTNPLVCTVCALRSIHLFPPLLEVAQFLATWRIYQAWEDQQSCL